MRHRALVFLAMTAGCLGSQSPIDPGPAPTGPGASLTFESGPVRPLALSSDGSRLFVANIADGYLEILDVTADGVMPSSSVAVGVDPVAVAVRNDREVWVVNQVSDSVSVVDVASQPPRVVRTLLVGDEPSDIVFGGAGRRRAFIATAHRGQQRTSPDLDGVPGAGDPQLTTAAVDRADVWVFDAEDLGASAGGTPLAIVTLGGDSPRALAVTPDGGTVYAAVFKSGNQTTVVSSLLTCEGEGVTRPCTILGMPIPGPALGPATNHDGIPAPQVGVIARVDPAGAWRDGIGRDWSAVVRFDLPDQDVFAIDAATLAPTGGYAHVGTTLFNMAVNPRSGKLYVSNTEARNDLRFEGPGMFAGATLEGHLAESRITVIDGAGAMPVIARRLNKHIPYDRLPAPAGIKERSLATPLDLAVSADGATLYVAAFGSGKVGVFATEALEADRLDPTTDSARYLTVTGGGPGGLALDEARHRLYVATRFDDGVSVIDLDEGRETAHVRLHSPETAAIMKGRRFLYDATVSSSNGEAACASCHMFGDDDHLAWDLGNPDGDVVETPISIKLGVAAGATINGTGDPTGLHPMKGPMATQTLRGLPNHGPMHWRGDRVSGFFGTDARTAPPYDAELAFKNFIVAFNGLLGLATPFDADDMQSFSDFALSIVMPPNPVRGLDNSLTDAEERGRSYFMGCAGADSATGGAVSCGPDGRPTAGGHLADGVPLPGLGFTCEGCHTLRPADGFFGTDGESSFEDLPQTMKIPQLRNLYDKIGMFGIAPNPAGDLGDPGREGPQVRGFGFTNDGTVDTIFHFLQGNVFAAQGDTVGFTGGDEQRRDVEQFMLAFDSDLAPVVGQQVTLSSETAAAAGPRIDLLHARALLPFASKVLGPDATECDLVARGVAGGRARAYRLRRDGSFETDDGSPALSDAALRRLATMPGQALTYTCLPPGWGGRALDRDRDGRRNGLDACPADPACQ